MGISRKKTLPSRNLAGAPWIPVKSRGVSDWTSPLTRNSLSVWDRMNKNDKYAHQVSPLGGYSWFPLGKEAGALGLWGSDGNTMCARYAPQGIISPFSELASSQGSIPLARWRYYQMTDFFNKLEPRLRPVSSLTTLRICVQRFQSLTICYPECIK